MKSTIYLDLHVYVKNYIYISVGILYIVLCNHNLYYTPLCIAIMI